MKPVHSVLLAGAVALGMAAPAAAQQINLKMATIAPGTSAYLTMTTMATMVNQALDDVNIQVDATGAATQHMVDVANGNLDMSMTSPTVYDFMKSGTVMYSQLPDAAELADNLRLVFWFPLGAYHFVVYADSGIESPADFSGKKIFLGPPGGGAYAAAVRTVRYMSGYEVGEDYDDVNASWSSATQGFQDRQFDVLTATGIAPFPLVEQLALTSQLRIIGLSEAEFEANTEFRDFIANTDGEEIGIIPAGVYGGGVVNTADVFTLGATVGVTARADLDEETVYRITKAYWEALSGAQESTPWMRGITLEVAVASAGMRLHPGALRYYQEIGVDIPEGSM
jgi:hypothetical protein